MAKMKILLLSLLAAQELPSLLVFWLAAASLSTTASAHTARATLDPTGTRATFTGLARVTCFNDGSGPAAGLYVRVRDNSPAVAGLMVSAQVLKGSQAAAISDTSSGDANWSDAVELNGGGGVYTVMINKTAAGERNFDLEWHCTTEGHNHDHSSPVPHTGTEILVDQFK